MSVAAVAQVKVETGVTFYTPDIVRIHKTWNDAPRQDYSVIMEPQQVKVSQSRDGDTKVYLLPVNHILDIFFIIFGKQMSVCINYSH